MTLPALAIAVLAVSSVFGANFDPESLKWRVPKPHARLDGNILTVEIPSDRYPATAVAVASVDPAVSRGSDGLLVSVEAWGEGIAEPKAKHLGLKSQLHWSDSAAKRQAWPNTKGRTGAFARTRLETHVLYDVARPDKIELQLGLQGTSGKVSFDLATLRITPVDYGFSAKNPDRIVGYPARTTGERRRGVMSPSRDMTEDDFKTLKSWGATLLRYQMVRNWSKRNDNRDLAEYASWLDGRLDHLAQTVLPLARKYGLKVVVDLHVPPGGREEHGQMKMMVDEKYAAAFVECWKRIATRFRGNADVIYGYDLINEPQQLEPSACGYWDVQRRAAEAVRAIDAETSIVVESNNWDAPMTFAYLGALDMDNVIYQAHMYVPMEFTHQGVHGSPCGAVYPDEKKGWNRDFLKRTLQPVRDFELRHRAKIYIGEFSAIAWAKGAENYIADCISIFEEYGWDWTYHAFREWEGWSVEHSGGTLKEMKPADDTPRKRALLDGFK